MIGGLENTILEIERGKGERKERRMDFPPQFRAKKTSFGMGERERDDENSGESLGNAQRN